MVYHKWTAYLVEQKSSWWLNIFLWIRLRHVAVPSYTVPRKDEINKNKTAAEVKNTTLLNQFISDDRILSVFYRLIENDISS